MAAGKKILLGCGLGCGGMILLVVLSGVGGAFWVRDSLKGFDQAIDLRNQVEERHGAVETYLPANDGALSAERMTAFLAVRTACSRSRQKIAETFGGFPMSDRAARELEEKPFFEKLRAVFSIGGSALGLAGELGEFFATRNQALLDQNMGLGEYTYIYVLAYNVWLDHSPQDGPGDGRIVIDGLNEGDDQDEREDTEKRFDLGLDRRIRRNLIRMLHNQLQAVESSEPGSAWSLRLAAEIDSLEKEREALPWGSGLPAAIAASFEPYREQLDSTYSPITNTFELGRNRRQGSFSIRSE